MAALAVDNLDPYFDVYRGDFLPLVDVVPLPSTGEIRRQLVMPSEERSKTKNEDR